ncbi:MAG: ABC transporter permease [Clostridiales Family XIII bacterium]|jgi:multidrug/hemolysin transport system permease protein|nr:ABC transporter permease [Clostridiales Family XIII bacterium]
MRYLWIRNLKIFFRDRANVFFSLLAVFIILGLHVLFLGDMWDAQTDGVKDIRLLVDTWMFGGLMAVVALSTTLGAFSALVADRAQKIYKDFYVSPLPRGRITAGYILSAFTVGLIMSAVALICVETYIGFSGGAVLHPAGWLKALGVILLGTLNGTALTGLIVSFVKSQNAYAVASTIFGTLVGFLTGVYLPLGVLPEAVQVAVKIFPGTHAGLLFRQILTEKQLALSFESLPASAAGDYREMMGITAKLGDFDITPAVSAVYLAATAALFFFLAVWNLSRKNRA